MKIAAPRAKSSGRMIATTPTQIATMPIVRSAAPGLRQARAHLRVE